MKSPTSPIETSSAPPIANPAANGSVDSATLELLASWRRQDFTTDPEQIRAAEEDLAEFKKAMNESRSATGEPVVYP